LSTEGSLMDAAVFASPLDSKTRLAELGLEERHLLEPARRGLLAWASCTPNHPQLFPSFYAWAQTVAALREGLLPLGWQRSEEAGLALVVNPSGSMAISVATGDEATGRAEDHPSTKSSKGPKTVDLITINKYQASLFPRDDYLSENLKALKDRTTWILLFCRDTVARELRCELSRPIAMDPEDRRVDEWLERIILTATPFDDDMVDFPVDNRPSAPAIDVEIKKRA
jgi:hypothetical protein